MRDFDLNLVRTLVLLYETRSVTATAESMHVTQPTVSYSLQKLRRRFSDELFLRTGSGLVPTTTATALYEPLRAALADIESAVSGPAAFDPGTARTAFVLCLSDLGEVALLPRLVAALSVRAPGVSLTVRPLDMDNTVDQLGRGEIDAFIASPLINSPRVARIPLFTEGYVGMVSATHPRLTGDRIEPGALAAERYITMFGPSGHDGLRQALEAKGLLDRVAVEVTRFAALPYLVQTSELVAGVPKMVADVFAAEHRVRLVELPLDIEPAQVSIYTRHAHTRTPAQHWLIELMSEILAAPPR